MKGQGGPDMFVRSVQDLIAGRPLPAVRNDVSVREACEVMDGLDIGALLVLRDGALVGILSERDVVRRAVLLGLDPMETPVGDIMTPDPQVIQASHGLAEAISLLDEGGFRHLPVMEGDRPVGLLSTRDVPAEYRQLLARFREMRGD